MCNAVEVSNEMARAMTFGRKRSPEFKEGAVAALVNLENLNTRGYRMRRCPYIQGTASHDAWYAGVREGKRMWHVQKAKKRLRGAADSMAVE